MYGPNIEQRYPDWREVGYMGPDLPGRVRVLTMHRTPAGMMRSVGSWYRLTGSPGLGYEHRSAMHPWVHGLPRCEATSAPEAMVDEDPDIDPDTLPHPLPWRDQEVVL